MFHKGKIAKLIRKECCNMINGNCLLRKDSQCCIIGKQELCKFFARCVLPLQPELEASYYSQYA
jgi:hypothetical protein